MPEISVLAFTYAIDRVFLDAVLKADQLRGYNQYPPDWKAREIRKHLVSYVSRKKVWPFESLGRYSEDFVRYFSNLYAPTSADNDPTGRNRPFYEALHQFYHAARKPPSGATV